MPRDMSKAQAAAAAARAARKAQAQETTVPKNLVTTQSADPFNGADPAKFDHDGDGSPGGSLPQDDDALARAAMQRQSRESAERAQMQREAERQAAQKVNPEDGSNRLKTVEALERETGERLRAARELVAAPEGPEPMVTVRITKMGDSKVSTGQHAPGVGEAYYLWKEEPRFPASVAQALEDRGFAEIL